MALRLCSNTVLRTVNLLKPQCMCNTKLVTNAKMWDAYATCLSPHEDASMRQHLPTPRSPSHAPALTASGIAVREQYNSWPCHDANNNILDGWWVGLACVVLRCIYMVPGQPQKKTAEPSERTRVEPLSKSSPRVGALSCPGNNQNNKQTSK